MGMFGTLFGGALVVIVLYYLLRTFGVGNYLRGVISGVVPLLSYLGWGLAYRPGGDVVSMHMAVFLATATGLTMIGGRAPGAARTLHWGPKLIITFFLLLFIIDGSFLLISGQGLPPSVARLILPPAKKTDRTANTAFPGVVPHGEEAAKGVNQYLASSDKQNRLGWNVGLFGLERLVSGREATAVVSTQRTDGRPLPGNNVVLALVRPGLSTPQQVVTLAEGDPGVYRARFTPTLPGLWVAVVRVERGGDRFELEQHVEVAVGQ